jgi:crotonobetainyl-CoA:carnitine CoA-transferase CaiB-like acyl-CoA transferase
MSWPAADQALAGPLAGVRVLDLSRILAGPFSAQILADLGADVIKVERAGVGDETRRWGPPFAPTGDAAYFFACNRGRRSVALDLRDDDDREVVLALARDADVLIENFLPGTLERMRLGDDVLWEANPALVHAVISGYGHQSSRASWPALDFVVQAHAGVLAVTGPDPQTGVKAGVPIADLSAGLYAAIGVLAALRSAQLSGRGERVEVSLSEACASLLTNQAMNYLIGGIEPRALGNTHPNVAPYQVIQAQDKALAVAATSEVQFARLCAVIGLDELARDERFATNAARVEHRDELERTVEERLRQRPAAEWVIALNEAGVAAAEINQVGEMMEDPDTRAGLIGELQTADGPVRQIRTPIRLGGDPLPLSSAPPRFGEHTDAIRAATNAAIGEVRA